MEWFLLAILSAFFAALVSIFAEIGLQDVDSTVGTSARAIIFTDLLLLAMKPN